MKKTMIMLLCLATFAGCEDKEKPKYLQALQQQRDSLNSIIEEKDNELNDMMDTFNDIQEGFREIDEAQRRVSVARQGEGSNSRERIKENIQFIQSAMKQNRDLINKLRNQLRASSLKSEQMKRTIETFVKQLEEKDQELQKLREELDAKDIHIMELDETIAGLNDNVESLTKESNSKTETISVQDKELNTAYYVFGTKKELKQQNIISGGEVMASNVNRNYFTKIDIRVDKEIKLYSSSAKILTHHPSSSYTLTRDTNKQYVLRISNPQEFWSASKYLVIQVK